MRIYPSYQYITVADAQGKEKLLQEERSRCKSLESELSQAKEAYASATRGLEELAQEKGRLEAHRKSAQAEIERLTSSCRDLEQNSREALKKIDSLGAGRSSQHSFAYRS